MDPRSGKPRRRKSTGSAGASSRRKKSMGQGGAGRGASEASTEASVSSSFAVVQASRNTIELPRAKAARPVWLGYLFGLLGVCGLIFMGGGPESLGFGMALLLPGVALLLKPPQRSLGKWVDWGIFGLLGVLLLAFVPAFYWAEPEWRSVGESAFGLELPAVLSVQPWISFEAWLMALAGFSWFYAVTAWRINAEGRERFYLLLCGVVAVIGVAVIRGDSSIYSFFQTPNQKASFLAIGGIVSFAFAMEALGRRKLLHWCGVLTSGLCLYALILGMSWTGVWLYVGGILIWFVSRLGSRSLPRFFKVGFPLVLLACGAVLTSQPQTQEQMMDVATAPTEWVGGERGALYTDTVAMIREAPVSGVGLGNFSAVFPQYREHSRSAESVAHPESDLFWLAAEGGLLALGFFGLFLGAYIVRCRGLSLGRGGAGRVIALVAVVVFLLHGLIDVTGHRPGSVYFVILFAALALPRSPGVGASLKPALWRVVGAVLVLFGLVWVLCGLSGLPLHSSTQLRSEGVAVQRSLEVGDYESAIGSMDSILEGRPLDWAAYSERAEYILSERGQKAAAAADFRRARFVEPTLGAFTLEEGMVWLPYDRGRALSAWRETLFRELEDKEAALLQMQEAAQGRGDLMDGLIVLTSIDSDDRTRMLTYLKGERLTQEIRKELALDSSMGRFNREQRTAIVLHWIGHGNRLAAEAYLKMHDGDLKDPWWLWALLRREQARFEEAVVYLRDALPAPEIPGLALGGKAAVRSYVREAQSPEGNAERTLDAKARAGLIRGFSVMPEDLIKGRVLLRLYLDEGNLKGALEVADALVGIREVPGYIHYWRGEILYQLEDYVESWSAFETYVKQLESRE